MPADTTLVYRRAESSTNAAQIVVYKFMSASSKGKIVAFYQRMFENDGFKEVKNKEAPQNMPQSLHMFTKKNKIIMMNILLRPEEPGMITYFIKYFDVIVPTVNPEELQ
jgi:aspartyl aminopeptidase